LITNLQYLDKMLTTVNLQIIHLQNALYFHFIYFILQALHMFQPLYGHMAIFKQSTAYNGVLVYNKLPSKIKSVKSVIKFKKIVSNFLLEKSFYSVEEFITVDSDVSLFCNCQCFVLCIMLIRVLSGPVHVCNYIRFTCLFAFTVILILFTVTILWTCPILFCNLFLGQNTIQYNITFSDSRQKHWIWGESYEPPEDGHIKAETYVGVAE
jgi:hypothetical protein